MALLSNSLNFSDGHARQPLNDKQLDVVSKLPLYFEQSLTYNQKYLEDNFIGEFERISKQSIRVHADTTCLSYSASDATRIVSTLIKKLDSNVSLIEPCFDNIFRLLGSDGHEPDLVSEETLLRTEDLKNQSFGDFIWLVLPNNPTGFHLDESSFTSLVGELQKQGKTLIIDTCFRFYCKAMYEYDQYKILNESNIDFIVIEDTGKTWPLADVKISICSCSKNLAKQIDELHDDLLLNVSPFHLIFLSNIMQLHNSENTFAEITEVVQKNKNIMRAIYECPQLTEKNHPGSMIPLEWIKVDSAIRATIISELQSSGFSILPGDHFFRADSIQRGHYLRIALSRDTALVEKLSLQIVDICSALIKGG